MTGRIVLLLVLAAASAAEAQTRRVEILSADVLDVTVDSLGEVQRAQGNVRMRQDTTTLWARQVTNYVSRGEVVLSGDVQIISGRDTLTSATVEYDATDKTAVARGAVRLGDGESVVQAPEMTYDSRAEFATFAGGGEIRHRGAVLSSPSGSYSSARRYARFDGPVRLVDSTGVLTAERGTYDARVRRADFAGSVLLRRPEEALDADSLVYFRRTERARAYGRTVLQRVDGEASQRSILFAETLLFDGQAETASARGLPADAAGPALDPLLLVLRTDSTGRVDSTLTRAARIDAARQIAGADTVTVVTAAGDVTVWERRLAASADSARFVRQAGGDTVWLFGRRPSLWADGAQLTGDSLAVAARDGAADTLSVWGRAFAARVDSTLGRLHQIAGGQMRGHFQGDELRRLAVWPNAQVLYFRATPAGLLDGADQFSLDSLSFQFQGGELREISGYRGIEGTSYGPSHVPGTLRLPGFAYDIEGAPTQLDVLGDTWEAGWLDRFGATFPEAEPPDAGRGQDQLPPAAPDASPAAASFGP